MITLEKTLPAVLGWFSYLFIAWCSEQRCASYYPFLLSAKYYITIKNPRLRRILISTTLTSSTDTKTAFKDRDKLPLCGCIHCMVIFPWLFCEMIIIFLVFILVLLGSDFLYSPIMSQLIDFCELLFTSKYYWLFIFCMPIVHYLDYSIGMQRYFK